MNEDGRVCLGKYFEGFSTCFDFILLLRIMKVQNVSEKYCTLDETDTITHQEGTA